MTAALAFLVLLALPPAARADDAPGPPRLEAGERVYDAGRVERGATVSHAFLLKNVGTAALSVAAKPG
jgi:hypothetical protein